MRSDRAIVVGAGVGGLAAAIDLASAGMDVTLLERSGQPGGKMRTVIAGGQGIDSGPTVLTMRDVFERLFHDAGDNLADRLPLRPASILARHAWSDGAQLDLHADLHASAEAIGVLSGAAEARRFLAFAERAAGIYRTLNNTFMRASRPGPLSLAWRVGLHRLPELIRISPFSTLWGALGQHFRDPRLRQLFGRYSTYCGSSPFAAPATLMLVAHVEQQGVWYLEGGMQSLAQALAGLAERCGVRIRYHSEVAAITTQTGRVSGVRLQDGCLLTAPTVVVNADPAALATGMLGAGVRKAVPPHRRKMRSLSAVTWSMTATSRGLPLIHHNVLFGDDYRAEFDAIFRQHRLPEQPTVYICAQDRFDSPPAEAGTPERFLCLINAPAIGDSASLSDSEIAKCEHRILGLMERCGLTLAFQPEQRVVTTPADFHRLYPGTGGALYGMASHGWTASFRRPTSSTRIPGLYLAGGGTHPGPGLPMATLSGRLAAQRVLADLTSARRWRPAAISGGTSTP